MNISENIRNTMSTYNMLTIAITVHFAFLCHFKTLACCEQMHPQLASDTKATLYCSTLDCLIESLVPVPTCSSLLSAGWCMSSCSHHELCAGHWTHIRQYALCLPRCSTCPMLPFSQRKTRTPSKKCLHSMFCIYQKPLMVHSLEHSWQCCIWFCGPCSH